MGTLRTPFFVIALVAIALVVLVELGSALILGGGSAGGSLLTRAADLHVTPTDVSGVEEPPGRAIRYLVLVDGVLLYTVALMGASMIVPERLHGRIQGVLTLVVSILLILGSLVLLVLAFVELMVMLALVAATPFGTIAYLALWGFFPRGDATVLLTLLTFLKIVFVVGLLLAHQRFLQNKGLVALVLTSLVADVVIAFLHGLVPIILVSIVDNIAAIVLAIVGIIWGVVLLIGSIPAIVKAIRVTASTAARSG